MRKLPWIYIACVALLFACGGKEQPAQPHTQPSGEEALSFGCGKRDTGIVYKTETIDNDVVFTYPDGAGYELGLSERVPGAYELFGEWDKDEHHTIEFFFIGMPKVKDMDEKQHLDQELAAARKEPGFELIETGKLQGVQYSSWYALTAMQKNGETYRGIILLHFDPLLSNYYYTMIQSSDLENYRKDICILFPFVEDLRFLKKR